MKCILVDNSVYTGTTTEVEVSKAESGKFIAVVHNASHNLILLLQDLVQQTREEENYCSSPPGSSSRPVMK